MLTRSRSHDRVTARHQRWAGRRWISLVVLAVTMVLTGGAGATVPTDIQRAEGRQLHPLPTQLEQDYVVSLNRVRAEVGLPPLVVDTELSELADSYAIVIANQAQLVHAPDLSIGVEAEWTKLGENLGFGPIDGTQQVMDAFVDSPAHYANIVDPSFDYVGVGVVIRGDRMWTVHRFRSDGSPSALRKPAEIDRLAFNPGAD